MILLIKPYKASFHGGFFLSLHRATFFQFRITPQGLTHDQPCGLWYDHRTFGVIRNNVAHAAGLFFMEQQQPLSDEIRYRIKRLILEWYMPASSPAEAKYFLNTEEIFSQLQKMFPSKDYSALDLATWLEEWGFKCRPTAAFKFEWLLKKKKNESSQVFVFEG